jgi:hypothetical protein
MTASLYSAELMAHSKTQFKTSNFRKLTQNTEPSFVDLKAILGRLVT